MTGRDRRRNAQPNAAMYVGYADDDEDVESIMAKFKAIEDAKGAKGGGDGGSGDDGVSDGKELTEEELIRATGARAPPKERVDYSAQLGHGNRANRKGEVVVAGTVELVPGHVPPEEIDPADAKDAADRLRAGEGFAPEEQEKCDVGSGNDARDPASGPPSSGIVPGVDVAMVNLKGFDAHTREKIAENMPHAVAEHDVDEFIDLVSQTMRLDAVAGADPSLESAAKTIAESKTATPAHRACAKALVKLCAKDPKEFKAKSKGVGLVVIRDGGIPRGEYLGAYCGELYPAWRWFEKEAAAQAVRRDVKRDDEVPTFYNAAVERDLHDPRGYDVLFIDGAVKGSVLTRASHSCQPNAEMRVRIREGKYSVEMVTTREVRTGEEICWDYRCQTDSEKEMRRAICLCGSKNCRVSYLHYNGESELAAFADENCAVLHDAARLLTSCVDADALRLPDPPGKGTPGKGTPGKGTPGKRGGHGGKRADDHWKSALIAAGVRADDEGMLAGLPQWARKFASKCVATAHEEKKFLTHSLYESAKRRAREAIEAARAEVAEYETDPESWLKRAGRNATPPTVPREPSDADLRADARAEASGIHAARVQSLAVTMDKVRRVLAVQTPGGDAEKPAAGVDVSAAPPPLRLLNDEASAAHLAAYGARLASAANVENPFASFDALSVDDVSAAGDENGSDKDAGRWVRSDAARRNLREMAENLWKRSMEDSGSEDRIARLACGDLAYLAATTRNLFTPVAGGKRFQSPYVAMGSTGSRDGAGVVRRMDYPANSALGFLCTWRDEYLERPCDRLATDARGGLCLPLFDRGAVTAAAAAGHKPGGNRRRCGAASIDALSAHISREMTARGGGKAWVPIDGCWRWDFDLDAGDGAPVLGSPVVDAALGGDARPGASAATELAAARRAVLGDDVEDARVADAELGKAAASKNGNEEEKKEEEEEEKEEEGEKEEEEERVALGAAETDADAVAAEPASLLPERSRRSPRTVTSPPVNRWGEPEPDVRCVVCGEFGDAADFILCDGCPSGGHVDCLNLPNLPSHPLAASAHSRDDWFCDACEGGKLAGIQPPGRGGFALAAANRAALERARERNGAHAGVAASAVPGATGAVPSVGPVAAHNLAEYHPVHLTTNCEVAPSPGDPTPPPPSAPLAESGGNKRAFWEGNATLGDDGKPTKAAAEAIAKRRRLGGSSFAPFPMPRDCPFGVIVECGGAWGEFRVLEGLVHCMCAGCEFGIAYGLQPTNVFGLQAFEFHGGKGSAGKWKASIRAHPDGFPDEYFAQVGVGAVGDDAPLAAAVTSAGPRRPGRPPRDTSEGLGPWLERECPEHPCLARSRNKETA